jgi:hypothetical protein
MSLKKVLLIVVAPILVVLIILFLILYSFINVSLVGLNGNGELQDTFISPDKEYKAELFNINKGGATVGDQERVGITSLKDNNKKFDDETIYWLYPAEEETQVEWKGKSLIEINGTVIDINDKSTYYNWKKDEDL